MVFDVTLACSCLPHLFCGVAWIRILLKSRNFPNARILNTSNIMSTDFYIRYYVGHKGKFGHEFLEFEFRPDGKLRYANNSNYKNDTMIRKEAYVHPCVMEELKRIIVDSEIMHEDDRLWPQPDRVGRQVSTPRLVRSPLAICRNKLSKIYLHLICMYFQLNVISSCSWCLPDNVKSYV